VILSIAPESSEIAEILLNNPNDLNGCKPTGSQAKVKVKKANLYSALL